MYALNDITSTLHHNIYNPTQLVRDASELLQLILNGERKRELLNTSAGRYPPHVQTLLIINIEQNTLILSPDGTTKQQTINAKIMLADRAGSECRRKKGAPLNKLGETSLAQSM